MWPFKRREPVSVYSIAGTKLYESLVAGEGWECRVGELTRASLDVRVFGSGRREHVSLWSGSNWTLRECFTDDDHRRLVPVVTRLLDDLKPGGGVDRLGREITFINKAVEKL